MKISQNDIDIKRGIFPANTDLEQVYALIERVTNKKYASCVVLELIEDDGGFDFFEVCDKDGKILIRSSNGVGLAAGFNAGYASGDPKSSWRANF